MLMLFEMNVLTIFFLPRLSKCRGPSYRVNVIYLSRDKKNMVYHIRTTTLSETTMRETDNVNEYSRYCHSYIYETEKTDKIDVRNYADY